MTNEDTAARAAYDALAAKHDAILADLMALTVADEV